MGPTIDVKFHTIVRQRDIDLAKFMWDVQVPVPFCYSKRTILTLPENIRPQSTYQGAEPCESKTGSSFNHLMFEQSDDFEAVKLNLQTLPKTKPLYAAAMKAICSQDDTQLDIELQRKAKGACDIGSFFELI